jgi:hypothetical protein
MSDMSDKRMAVCPSCKTEIPSDSPHASFVIPRGVGSRYATEVCKCGYDKIAHGKLNKSTGRPGITDHEFEPRGPHEKDTYYCGCRGWD